MQIYWINNEEIKLIIDGKIEILTPDKLIIKYGDNVAVMNEIQELLKNPKNDFLTIYDKILNESRYDEKYAVIEKINDGKLGLSAYEVMIKNIMRTKKDKKGTCQAFSMRIQDELDILGLDNHLLIINKNDDLHYANLYIDDNNLYVADIAIDLIEKEYLLDQEEDQYMIPKNFRIPLNNYLYDNDVMYVQERIKDDSRKFKDLNVKTIKSFVINYELMN